MERNGTLKRDRLRQVPLFAGLTSSSLTYVAMHCSELSFAAGDVLCRQGDHGRELLIVESGRVRIRRDGEVVGEATDGDVIGELAILDRGPRSADLEAVEDTQVLAVEHDDFRRVVQQAPEVALELLAELAGRLRTARAG